jgi:hypothetical protein
MNPDAVRFFTVLAISLIILMFCFFEIAYNGQQCNCGLYSTIGIVIGFWFDAPRLKRGDT